MAQVDRQQAVLSLLQNLRDLDGLKKLFWEELNYERENKPLSVRQWPDSAKDALAEDPILFASGGEDNAFHVVYCRLNSEALLRGLERPVVNRLMKEHPYALFVFSNKSKTYWHLLNVKYDEEIEKRRLIRRITIGPGERLRTASQRVQLLDLQGLGPELFALPPMTIQDRCDEAFDVEAVTKEFFEKFAELYHRVADDIAEVRGLEKEAGKLAQLILDRMIFLYFIQKKGWLNQQPDYLYDRFLECWRNDPKGSTYYTGVLYPLFLCLSDAAQSFDKLGAVPFLNGGLFEESVQQSQGDRIAQARLQIKNRTFKAVFDELLEHFNFTVTEDTPLDIEVAIDPEMLGKIFESLILQLENDPDTDLRQLTGSYYTPRVIVHFMCQEALRHFLTEKLESKDAKSISTTIHQFLELPPADQLDDDQVAILANLFSEAQAKALRQIILRCRVCDPAVGSGAFPVGMLHEITSAVARLDVRLHGREYIRRRNYDYDLKKQVVEACLYGVDIQDQAVRLCELRLWLSLVVDYQIDGKKPFEEAIRDIPSLPNLSYRIMRGDSLLERLFGHVVQLDKMSKDERTKELIDSIQSDKRTYFQESGNDAKRRLELKIFAKQADLAERLIESKQKDMEHKGYQTNIFGDAGMSAQDLRAKTLHEQRARDLSDLRGRVRGARDRIESLARQKHRIGKGDLETLRAQYFQTGEAPTFMWRLDFAEVFSDSGGFDIVIANPPYLRIQRLADIRDILPQFYSSATGKYDIYVLFVEQGARILRRRGTLVYIMPNKFLNAAYGKGLLDFVSRSQSIVGFLNFRRMKIFEEATNYVCVTALRNHPATETTGDSGRVYVVESEDRKDIDAAIYQFHRQTASPLSVDSILPRLGIQPTVAGRETKPLSVVCPYIFQGLISGGDKLLYLQDGGKTKGNLRLVYDRHADQEYWLETAFLRKLLFGRDIARYTPPQSTRFAVYPYKSVGQQTMLVRDSELRDEAPNVFKFLAERKTALSERGSDSMEYEHWYAYWCPREMWKFESPKILTQVLANRASFTFDPRGGFYFVGGGNAGVYGLIADPDILGNKEIDYLYLLGLLNSKPIDEQIKAGSSIFRGGYYSYGKKFIADVPVLLPDEKTKQRIAAKVKKVLAAEGDAESAQDELDAEFARLYGV